MSHKDGQVVLSAWVDPVLRIYKAERDALYSALSEAGISHGGTVEGLRQGLEVVARLKAERDEARAELASISEEFGLPPTIRPVEGEIRRMLDGWREARAKCAALREALDDLLASDEGAYDAPTQRVAREKARAALAATDSSEWLRALVTRAVEAGDNNVDGDDARRIRPLADVVEEVLNGKA